MKKVRVGIVGCGTIGTAVAQACATRLCTQLQLIGICDTQPHRAQVLRRTLRGAIPVLGLDRLAMQADIIVEAAHVNAVTSVLAAAIRRKKDLLVMSVGGLIAHPALVKKIERSTIRVYVPSGALCGIDGLKAAGMGKIRSVVLTTRKPPAGLAGAPYIIAHKIDLAAIRRETVVFDGTAKAAVRGFPQNVNVAAVVALAGIGAARTRVRIVTSPVYTKNTHELEITSDSGMITTKTQNVPDPDNPKTSRLAIRAALATLVGSTNRIHIGT